MESRCKFVRILFFLISFIFFFFVFSHHPIDSPRLICFCRPVHYEANKGLFSTGHAKNSWSKHRREKDNNPIQLYVSKYPRWRLYTKALIWCSGGACKIVLPKIKKGDHCRTTMQSFHMMNLLKSQGLPRIQRFINLQPLAPRPSNCWISQLILTQQGVTKYKLILDFFTPNLAKPRGNLPASICSTPCAGTCTGPPVSPVSGVAKDKVATGVGLKKNLRSLNTLLLCRSAALLLCYSARKDFKMTALIVMLGVSILAVSLCWTKFRFVRWNATPW